MEEVILKKSKSTLTVFLIIVILLFEFPVCSYAMGNILGEFNVLGSVYETEN